MSATDEIRWLCTCCREVFTATKDCQCPPGKRKAETSLERARACNLFTTPDGEDSEAVKAIKAARAAAILEVATQPIDVLFDRSTPLVEVPPPATFTAEYVNGSMVNEDETRRQLDRMFAGGREVTLTIPAPRTDLQTSCSQCKYQETLEFGEACRKCGLPADTAGMPKVSTAPTTHAHALGGKRNAAACGASDGRVSGFNEDSDCRACEDAIRVLSPMPVPKHRMFRVTNEQTWEEP